MDRRRASDREVRSRWRSVREGEAPIRATDGRGTWCERDYRCARNRGWRGNERAHWCAQVQHRHAAAAPDACAGV